MAIELKVPHNDLVVRHEVVGDYFINGVEGEEEGEEPLEAYLAHLFNPDGSEAAPTIVFHKGSPVDGWHGWTTAHAISALIKHMEHHQGTPFACEENKRILFHLKAAHAVTEERANERKDRGVLYDTEKP